LRRPTGRSTCRTGSWWTAAGGLTFPPIWADLAGQLELVFQATEGNPPSAAVKSALTKSGGPIEGYDNSNEALLSIACSDSTNPRNPEAWPKLAADADAHAPYFGADWAYLVQPCATWPGHDHDRYTGPFTTKTANPLLFVSSRFDAASSYEHTQALVASIPGAASRPRWSRAPRFVRPRHVHQRRDHQVLGWPGGAGGGHDLPTRPSAVRGERSTLT
jgi:hypothetical protein